MSFVGHGGHCERQSCSQRGETGTDHSVVCPVHTPSRLSDHVWHYGADLIWPWQGTLPPTSMTLGATNGWSVLPHWTCKLRKLTMLSQGHFGLSYVSSPQLSWHDFFLHSQPLSGYERGRYVVFCCIYVVAELLGCMLNHFPVTLLLSFIKF